MVAIKYAPLLVAGLSVCGGVGALLLQQCQDRPGITPPAVEPASTSDGTLQQVATHIVPELQDATRVQEMKRGLAPPTTEDTKKTIGYALQNPAFIDTTKAALDVDPATNAIVQQILRNSSTFIQACEVTFSGPDTASPSGSGANGMTSSSLPVFPNGLPRVSSQALVEALLSIVNRIEQSVPGPATAGSLMDVGGALKNVTALGAGLAVSYRP